MSTYKIIDVNASPEAVNVVQTKEVLLWIEEAFSADVAWAALYPWAEPTTVDADGQVTQVHCTICSKIEGREMLYVPKIDNLWKHTGQNSVEKAMVNKKVVKGHSIFQGQQAMRGTQSFCFLILPILSSAKLSPLSPWKESKNWFNLLWFLLC